MRILNKKFTKQNIFYYESKIFLLDLNFSLFLYFDTEENK